MQHVLEQVIYTSVASDNFDAGDLFKIVETATRKNADREITGILVFERGHFFQVIEGPGAQLDRLLVTLRRDPRHHSLRILKRRQSDHRLFPKWRMRRVVIGERQAAWGAFRTLLQRRDDALMIASEFDRFLQRSEIAA